ncbi:MAG: 4-(cytidine 5'-diphospho)-2-C-methyl-D-erythritol kinase [Clostridiales bacterium]
MMSYYSAAKINLYLGVHEKMESGYHEITSVMQSVSLFDRLDFDFEQRDFQLDTGDKNLGEKSQNTVTRSWELMKEKFDLPEEVHVKLVKNIPMDAGLAGGSGDGAAMLHGVNDYFKLGLSLEELGEIGAEIGADVPFCVMGGTALARGKGEKLEKLPDFPNCQIPLVNSGILVSTKEAFAAYDELPDKNHVGDEKAMVEAIKQNDLPKIAAALYNDLESVVLAKYPSLQKQKEDWCHRGLYPLMSGSGASIFALCVDNSWKKLMEEWKNENGRLFFVRPVTHGVTRYEKK